MTALHRFAIRRPCTTLALTLLCVIAAAPGLIRLRLRTDGHALVPAQAPPVQLDRSLRNEFGLKDNIAVIVHAPEREGIFNPRTLRVVDDLTTRLSTLEGVLPSDVTSLATEKGHRVRPGTLQFLRFFEPVPSTPQQCATLRDDLRLIKIYNGILVSADETSTCILVGVPENVDRIRFYRQVQEIIDATTAHRAAGEELSQSNGQDVIRVTGAPVAESLLGTHILEDLGVRPAWIGAASALDGAGRVTFPQSIDDLRRLIARSIGILPIALAIMAFIFFVSFRSAAAALLTLLKVGMCLLIVFGIMGWFDVPIYLTIAVMPVILTATGVSDEVHIFDCYARQLRGRGAANVTNAAGPLMAAMDEMWRPVVMTSVTTAFGFLSFAISPLAPVRAFGLFTGIGSLLCMLWALTATPALVALVHPKRFGGARVRESLTAPHSSPFFARLGDWVVARRRAILAGFVILLGISWLGMRRVYVQDSWIDGFSPASDFYKTTTAFNDQFLGMHVLFVCVDTHSKTLTGEIDSADVDHFSVKLPSDFAADPASLVHQTLELRLAHPPPVTPSRPIEIVHRAQVDSAFRQGGRMVVNFSRTSGSPRFTLGLDQNPRVRVRVAPEPLLRTDCLKWIKDLEDFIASRRAETVGGTLGPARYIETTNFIGMGCREEHRCIPQPDRLEFVWRWYGTIRGPARLRATVDPDYSRGIISVYMKNANFVDTARLLGLIRDYERQHLSPHGMSLSFAGDVAVSQTLIDAIATTQIGSIALSILGVFVSAVAVHRSLKWGLLCAIPAALAVPLTFGLMGFAGIPLGVATSMFAAMAVGIGDDYAIHFIERFRLAAAKARCADEAIRQTLVDAGPANAIDAASVALGFGVLGLSQVPANARLGIMVLASILTCLVATLILLPALLRAIQPAELEPSALPASAAD